MKTIFRNQRLGLLAGLVIATLSQSTAQSDDALELELRAMASQHVLPLIKKRGGGAIAVGGFTAATSLKGGVGPEIQMKLSQILQQLDANVDSDNYRYEVTGNYLPYNDPDSGLSGVKLVTRLVDAEDGTTLGEFPRFVFGPESVPRMLGLIVSTRGSSDPNVQSAAFRKALRSPDTFLVGAQVSASPGSQYSVEVLVRQHGQYQPRRISKDSKSRAFVEIAQDEVYAIRLINHSDYEAAVRLTIDGVNAFQFSKQSPRPNHWVVPAKTNGQPGVTLVRGWDETANSSIEFKVVGFPDSAAARVKLRPSSNIGLITASFAACWIDEKDRPRSEGRTRATGFGNQIIDQKTLVKRYVGQVRDVVSIRYERNSIDRDPVAMLLPGYTVAMGPLWAY